MPIQRITCFKILNQDDIPALQDQYRILRETNQKDGKPYILSNEAGPTTGDTRAQGYNFIALTRFASEEDVRFYDEECEAHKAYKAFAQGKAEGAPLVLLMRI